MIPWLGNHKYEREYLVYLWTKPFKEKTLSYAEFVKRVEVKQ